MYYDPIRKRQSIDLQGNEFLEKVYDNPSGFSLDNVFLRDKTLETIHILRR